MNQQDKIIATTPEQQFDAQLQLDYQNTCDLIDLLALQIASPTFGDNDVKLRIRIASYLAYNVVHKANLENILPED